jgi:hypothetical protein
MHILGRKACGKETIVQSLAYARRCQRVNWIHLAPATDHCRFLVNKDMNFPLSYKAGKFLHKLRNYQIFKGDFAERNQVAS